MFPSGVAAKEGSIREGDQVLSINGNALCGNAHWEALRSLRRAKAREMVVVVLRKSDVSGAPQKIGQKNNERVAQTPQETGLRLYCSGSAKITLLSVEQRFKVTSFVSAPPPRPTGVCAAAEEQQGFGLQPAGRCGLQ